MKISRRTFSVSLTGSALAGMTGASFAQSSSAGQAASFPSKPIKVLISVPPGGTMDVLTRAIANAVRESLGPLVLDHKSGANGNIALELAKAAEPDGHTLILGTASMMTMNPHAYKEIRFDVFKDYTPIVLASRFELALCTHPSVPATNVKELIEWFKANPSKASIASYGAGTPAHFLIEMLASAAGVKIQHIPYRGATQAMQDLLGGQVLVFINVVGGSIQAFRAGRIKVLASSGTKRTPFMPDVPTFVEQGFPTVSATAWFAYFAPAKTPPAIVAKLNASFNKALQSREVRQQLLASGMYPVGGTQQELAETMRKDYQQWQGVTRAMNFSAT